MELVIKHLTCRQSSWSIPSLKLSAIKSKLSLSTSFTFPLAVQSCHIDFRSLESDMPIFLVNWTPKIIGWVLVSRSTTLGVCPPTWIANLVLSIMVTSVTMEVFSLGTTFRNEWKTLWREWLSTTPVLNNKSTSEVFLTLFWYVNVELEVGEPTILAMLELLTRLWMPSTTCEPIECLSKVLGGTHVACGWGIGRWPNVVFKVSFSTIIMSLVLSFKSWNLNNGVLTSFCTISCIWSWHSISWLVENCVFSSCTCTPRTWEFDALKTCGVIVSSPLANKVCSSSMWKGRKNCGMTVQAPLALVIKLEHDVSPSVRITYLVGKTLGATLASCVAK